MDLLLLILISLQAIAGMIMYKTVLKRQDEFQKALKRFIDIEKKFDKSIDDLSDEANIKINELQSMLDDAIDELGKNVNGLNSDINDMNKVVDDNSSNVNNQLVVSLTELKAEVESLRVQINEIDKSTDLEQLKKEIKLISDKVDSVKPTDSKSNLAEKIHGVEAVLYGFRMDIEAMKGVGAKVDKSIQALKRIKKAAIESGDENTSNAIGDI